MGKSFCDPTAWSEAALDGDFKMIAALLFLAAVIFLFLCLGEWRRASGRTSGRVPSDLSNSIHALDIAERLIRDVDKMAMGADRERNEARNDYVAAQADLAALKREIARAAGAYNRKAGMRGGMCDLLGLNGVRRASQAWRTGLRLVFRKRNTEAE